MIIHFVEDESAVTLCGVSTAGRDLVPVTKNKRDVTCADCKNELAVPFK